MKVPDRCSVSIVKSIIQCFEKPSQYYILRPFLPYCITKINGKWLPLNRDYKPLGISDSAFVPYQEFDYMLIPSEELNLNEGAYTIGPLDNLQYIYFFTDASTPRDRKNLDLYLKQLRHTFISKQKKEETYMGKI